MKKRQKQAITLAPMPQSNSPHAPLPALPFELIIEILARLPVKYLIQFKCVCKSWETLISHDPKFAKKHLSTTNTAHFISRFVSPYGEIFKSFSIQSIFNNLAPIQTHLQYPIKILDNNNFILGSCDGMLCFSLTINNVILWNPSIRKFKRLPILQNKRRNSVFALFGFGYDHFGHSYKVVSIFGYKSGRGDTTSFENKVKVFTLGTDYWRGIQEFPSGVRPTDTRGTFVNGTLNWLVFVPNNRSSKFIVSLDLGKEKYQELLLPDYGKISPNPKEAKVTLTLGVMRNCLCVLVDSIKFSDVWLMKDYGNNMSWTKLFRIPAYMGNDVYMYQPSALCISEYEEVMLECEVRAQPECENCVKVVVYNTRDGTFKIPEIQDISVGDDSWFLSNVYAESLISPCS